MDVRQEDRNLAATLATGPERDDENYEAFLFALRVRFASVAKNHARLFATDASNLFDAFLAEIPADRRRHYTCRACRRFVDRFGGLVWISTDGRTTPVVWDDSEVPEFFRGAVAAVFRLVARARVTGVFLSEETTWGMPSNRSKVPPYEWHHMAVAPSASHVFARPDLEVAPFKSAEQAAAEKLEDYGTLSRVVAEFPFAVAAEAHTLLASGNLYRSEKCVGVARRFLDLHEALRDAKGSAARRNVIWLAAANAPSGFCHLRSSMIGTLLQDIGEGLLFPELKRRFDEKMNPLKYQRPMATPSAGNVEQAEKIVAALQSAGALNRRFARLEDIETIWKPKPPKQEADRGGVFGHIRTREQPGREPTPIDRPPVTMTWEKFARTVLPEAEQIEFLVPRISSAFVAMVTAVHPDSPPILQYDREDRRNRVSWYMYSGHSQARRWNLREGEHCKVSAVALQPTMWDPEAGHEHQGAGVFFLLEGARDLDYSVGAGFFPELLRSEYRAVRATMEKYANAAAIAGTAEATACGIRLDTTRSRWSETFRVTTKTGRASYVLDRWD